MEAKRLAAARPIPEAPPVMTATEPADNLFSVLI
jgi:ABC-type ATPase involved in cell division